MAEWPQWVDLQKLGRPPIDPNSSRPFDVCRAAVADSSAESDQAAVEVGQHTTLLLH